MLQHAHSLWLGYSRADGGVQLPYKPLAKSVGALRWGHTAGETALWSAGGKSLPRAVQCQRKIRHSGIASLAGLRESCKVHTIHPDCNHGSLTVSCLVKLFLIFSREQIFYGRHLGSLLNTRQVNILQHLTSTALRLY